jgi:hypothetical protein
MLHDACEIPAPNLDCLSGYCGTPYIITAPEVYTDFSYSEKQGRTRMNEGERTRTNKDERG